VRFYLDENVPEAIATFLKKHHFDVLTAEEAGNRHRTDAEHLTFAARTGRCLVTFNVIHFKPLGDAAIRRQEPHAGILFILGSFRGSEIRRMGEALLQIRTQYPNGLGEYVVMYLPRSK